MQSQRQARYQDVVATVITVAIHAVVVVFLLMNLRISGALNPEPVVAEAIPAEVIDEVAIRQELEQLAEEDRRRQRVEAERQARLIQNTVFHSVEQIQIKSNHHPNY
jgi:membrane protein involved in colicin uptake